MPTFSMRQGGVAVVVAGNRPLEAQADQLGRLDDEVAGLDSIGGVEDRREKDTQAKQAAHG
jgi:hypothetical protein